MNPVDGLYVLFPDTVADPTVVPPVVQVLGGDVCGPNTVNVAVPVGDEPPDNVLDIDDPAIGEFAAPLDGAITADMPVAATAVAVTEVVV